MRGSRVVEGSRKRLVLVAMMFAVAMTFIDQTIVAIAIPSLQTVFYVMAATFLITVRFYPRGRSQPQDVGAPVHVQVAQR